MLRTNARAVQRSALTLLFLAAAGCGSPLVGDSEYQNRAPTIEAIADLTTPEDTPVSGVAITVADEDVDDVLALSAESSDPSIVDAANVTFTGAGTAWTMAIAPEPDAFGTVTITVVVSDGELTASTSFALTVTPVNDAPTLTGLADVTLEEDGTATVDFTVADVDDAASDLAVGASSGNTTLLPDSGLSLGGSGGTRTITITPAPDQNGMATVTVTVSDGELDATGSFVVTVTPVNDAPTISDIADQMTNEDTPTGAIAFTVGDVDTPLGELMLTCDPADDVLIASCVFGGADGARTVTLTPAADLHGATLVTITVSDGALDATDTFTLTVVSVDDAPVITLTDSRIDVDRFDQIDEDPDPPPTYTFTISDVDDDPSTLVLAFASNDGSIVASPGGGSFGGSGGNRTVTVTPNLDANGTVRITLTVRDPDDAALSDSDFFDLEIVADNDAPVITASFGTQTIDEDTQLGPLELAVSDTEDLPPTEMTASCGSTDNTTLVPNGACEVACDWATGECWLTLIPALNQSGTATVTITLTDTGGRSTTYDFDLVVEPVDDAPIAADYDLSTACNIHEEVAFDFEGDASDADGDTVTLVPVTDDATEAGGTITIEADGDVFYVPPPGLLGSNVDSYDYEVTDGGLTGTGTITIDLAAPCTWHVRNDAPPDGDGTDVAPFDTLAEADAATPDANSVILLFAGDETTAGQDEGVSLAAGQSLVGVPDEDGPTLPILTNTGGDAVTLTGGNAVSGVSIADADGLAISGTDITAANTITSVTITGGTDGGISVTGAAGSSLALTDVTIDVDGGTGLAVDGVGTLTIAGTASVVTADGLALSLANTAMGGGVGTFDEVACDASSSGGVYLDSVSGEVEILLLTLVTDESTGLEANAVGTLTIGDGSIVTTGAGAISIVGATADVTLDSVDCDAEDASVSPIVLDTVGGSFVVGDDGTTTRSTTGGVITGADDPIVITDSSGIELHHMEIHEGDSGIAISATGVTDFAVRHSSIVGVAGGSPGSVFGQVELDEPRGAIVFENTDFELLASCAVVVTTTDTSGADTLSVTDSEIGFAAATADRCGLFVEADADADLAITVANTTFTGLGNVAVDVAVDTGADVALDVSGTFDLVERAVDATCYGTGSTLDLAAHDSAVTRSQLSAFRVRSGDGVSSTASTLATFDAIAFGDEDADLPATFSGNGILLDARGAGRMRARVFDSTFYEPDDLAVSATASGGGAGGGELHLWLENNDFTMGGGGGSSSLSFEASEANPICVNLVDNDHQTTDRDDFAFSGTSDAAVSVQGFADSGTAALITYLKTNPVPGNSFGVAVIADAPDDNVIGTATPCDVPAP